MTFSDSDVSYAIAEAFSNDKGYYLPAQGDCDLFELEHSLRLELKLEFPDGSNLVLMSESIFSGLA